MKLNEATRETKKVAQHMQGEKWGVYQRFSDLIEEVGELANAIQVKEGWKTKKRSKLEVVNSICDVLYELLLIADYFDVNLEREYPKVLEEIDKRRKKGEFDYI